MVKSLKKVSNSVVGSSIVAAGLKFAGVGLSFLFLLVLAQKMSALEFGIFSVGFSVAHLTWCFATFGQPVTSVRFWPVLDERYGPATANLVIERGFRIVGLLSLLMFAVFVVVANLNLEIGELSGQSVALIWSGVLAVALALSQFMCFSLRARGDLMWSLTPRDVVWRAIVIVVLLFVDEITGMQGLRLAALVLLGVTAAQVLRFARFRRATLAAEPSGAAATIPPTELAEMRRAQWGLWGVNISRQWLQQAGTVVVAIVLGPIAAGAFFAAQRLANLLSLVLVGTNQVSGPMISRDFHAGRKEGLQTLISVLVVITAGASLVGLIVFAVIGRWMLGLFDPEYVNAFGALLVLGFAQLVNSACGPNGNLLNLAGLERRLFVVTIVAGIANLGLTALGAYYYGLLGAAVGAAAATILWNVWATAICANSLGIYILRPRDILNFKALFNELKARRRMKGGVKND